MSENVQTLDGLTLAGAEKLWARVSSNLTTEGAFMITHVAEELQPDDQQRFLRGKRAALWRGVFGCHSRSAAYDAKRAGALGLVLHSLGLMDINNGWRDVSTQRRCKVRVIEVARLNWSWDSEDCRAWLKDNWPDIVGTSLAELKKIVKVMQQHDRRRSNDGVGPREAGVTVA